MPNGVEFEGRLAHVGTFPIGIEPKSFIDVSCIIRHLIHTLIDSSQNLQKPGVIDRISQLEQRFRGVKVIVGVDRLDYIKGVPQKLHALELFLTQHPEWIGKVCCFSLPSSRIILICIIPGGHGSTGGAIPPRRRGISKLEVDCQRAGWTNQRAIRNCGIHADSLYAQES